MGSGLVDARALVPLTQAMIDACIPLAEAVTPEGDFTITLYIKRRKGDVLADANLSVKAGKR